MNIVRGKKKRGPTRKPKTKAEATAAEHASQTRAGFRRVSGQDRKFVELYVESGLRHPDLAARAAGFASPGIGWKLVERLGHLIDAERVRLTMGEQMEVEEALRLAAEGARDVGDRKVQVQFLTLVLRANGVLSDKPMPVGNRRQLVREVSELLDQIKRKAGPGGMAKVRAVLETRDGERLGIEAESSGGGGGGAAAVGPDPGLGSAIDVEASTSETSASAASGALAPSRQQPR